MHLMSALKTFFGWNLQNCCCAMWIRRFLFGLLPGHCGRDRCKCTHARFLENKMCIQRRRWRRIYNNGIAYYNLIIFEENKQSSSWQSFSSLPSWQPTWLSCFSFFPAPPEHGGIFRTGFLLWDAFLPYFQQGRRPGAFVSKQLFRLNPCRMVHSRPYRLLWSRCCWIYETGVGSMMKGKGVMMMIGADMGKKGD